MTSVVLPRMGKFARYAVRLRQSPAKVRVRPKTLPGSMNKLEQQYAEYLDARPDVLLWRFECHTFRLADGCTYRPDFKVVVMRQDRTTWAEYHEVKARWKVRDKQTREVVGERVHMEDDAKVKIKVAAEQYPEEQFVIVSFAKNLNRWEENRL